MLFVWVGPGCVFVLCFARSVHHSCAVVWCLMRLIFATGHYRVSVEGCIFLQDVNVIPVGDGLSSILCVCFLHYSVIA